MILFIVQVFVVCVIGFVNADCNQKDNSLKLYFLSNDNLWLLDINETNTRQRLVNDARNVIDYDFDYSRDRLTWIDDEGRIFFGNQTKQEFVYKFSPILLSTRIAFSSEIGKFYVNEGNYSKIWMIDSKGQNRTAMFDCDSLKKRHSVNEQVKKVVLDAGAGFFFVLTEIKDIKNIYIFKMDGTFKKVLISSPNVMHFDVDRESRRVYWDDSEKSGILSTDYEGYNKLNVVKMDKLEPFAVHGNKILWPSNDYGFRHEYRIEMCTLCDNVCEKSSIRRVQLDKLREKPYSLKIKQQLSTQNNISK